MNIAEAKEQIKDTVDGYLTQDETGGYLIPPVWQRPLFLLGAPGIGKTAIVSQVASELGIGLVSYSMTHHTRQSALGLPLIVERTFGDEQFEISEYTMSEIIASVYDFMEQTGLARGILFLDEINCVSETLYPSMLQFLQFKTFGRYQVPSGWIIVCAGNPPEYNRSVYEFDVVTLDRLRKIEIEPDLGAWMDYALRTGVHPAVISYLEVKPDQFYAMETTPSGKTFVTARGWDDLSRMIKLFEMKGKRVDRALIGQFLQHDEIAERFAQYYALFSKYRSDYQVAAILEGRAPDKIVERVRKARFDERLALIHLILDGLDTRMAETLETERAIGMVRDALRSAKESILAGASVEDTVGRSAGQIDQDARRRVAMRRATDLDTRPDRRAASMLQGYLEACGQRHETAGPTAFAIIQEGYGQAVRQLRETVDGTSASLDNAFAFIEEACPEGRETAVFVAELTARTATSQFISTFGSESYYAHNATVLVDHGRRDLVERVRNLDLGFDDEVAT
jgi:hypothetical protein